MQHNASSPFFLATPLRALGKGNGLIQEQAGSSASLLPKTISALENNSLLKIASALEMELIFQPRAALTNIRESGRR